MNWNGILLYLCIGSFIFIYYVQFVRGESLIAVEIRDRLADRLASILLGSYYCSRCRRQIAQGSRLRQRHSPLEQSNADLSDGYKAEENKFRVPRKPSEFEITTVLYWKCRRELN